MSSLGVSVYFSGKFLYDFIPSLLKYITTNTELWRWIILIYCMIVIFCIFVYLYKKIIFTVLLLKRTLKFIYLWNYIPIYLLSFILTIIGIIVNSIISLAVYGTIVKYDNSEDKNKTNTTLTILFYLVSYNYFNQLIKKIVNVTLSRRFSNYCNNNNESTPELIVKSFLINFGSIFIGSFAIALLGILKKIPDIIKLFFSPIIFAKHFILSYTDRENKSWSSLFLNFIMTLIASPIHALLYYVVSSFSIIINFFIKYFDGIAISLSGITGTSFIKSYQHVLNVKGNNEKSCFDCSSFIGFILFVGQVGVTWLTYIIINFWNDNKNKNIEDEESILNFTKRIDDLGLIVLICNKIFFGLIKSIIQASFDTSLVYYLNDKKVINISNQCFLGIDRCFDVEECFDLDLEENINDWFDRIQGDKFQDFEEIFKEFLPIPGGK